MPFLCSYFLESLITPDLWLKNCRTRSPSPEQYSKSPSPMTRGEEVKSTMPKIIITQEASPSSSSAQITSSVSKLTHNEISCSVKKPMINVLPSSKLLSRNILHHRNIRKRRASARLAMSNKGNQNSNSDNNSFSERIMSMNPNYPPDLLGKIHTQVNSSPKPIPTTSFNHPQLQFMHRPPMNLFKFRLPYPLPKTSQNMHMPPLPQHQQRPAPEDSNLNSLPSANSFLPPTIVLVPYPIPLPIILPIPLPISAFIKAYQRKKSELSTNKNANESHGEMRTAEEDEPLDLSSEQTLFEGDKISLNQHKVDDINGNKSAKNNESDEIPNFGGNLSKDLSEYSCENSRPLRKRKIIDLNECH